MEEFTLPLICPRAQGSQGWSSGGAAARSATCPDGGGAGGGSVGGAISVGWTATAGGTSVGGGAAVAGTAVGGSAVGGSAVGSGSTVAGIEVGRSVAIGSTSSSVSGTPSAVRGSAEGSVLSGANGMRISPIASSGKMMAAMRPLRPLLQSARYHVQDFTTATFSCSITGGPPWRQWIDSGGAGLYHGSCLLRKALWRRSKTACTVLDDGRVRGLARRLAQQRRRGA